MKEILFWRIICFQPCGNSLGRHTLHKAKLIKTWMDEPWPHPHWKLENCDELEQWLWVRPSCPDTSAWTHICSSGWMGMNIRINVDQTFSSFKDYFFLLFFLQSHFPDLVVKRASFNRLYIAMFGNSWKSVLHTYSYSDWTQICRENFSCFWT